MGVQGIYLAKKENPKLGVDLDCYPKPFGLSVALRKSIALR